MASQAHAFFCFEVLNANFQGTQHPSLQQILSFFDDDSKPTDAQLLIIDEQQHLDHKDETVQDFQNPTALLPPSIARLQANDNSSRSSTSNSTTVSTNSSTSHLSDSTGPTVLTSSAGGPRISISKSYPLFVTWNTMSRSGQKALRGCIGTFEGLPLEKGLAQYALTSAFEDTRFSPIPSSQISNLSCSLTLLADFEEGQDPLDWTLGVHGIRISFTYRYRRHGATYLPDVAVEQGWTQEETLESLMRKAGWEPTARRLLKANVKPWEEVKDFKLVRYTGLKATASYDEWQAWRSSIDLE